MWDLGNRGSVVLISLTFGCVLVYNAWGAILALAFTLFLVVYACYSLLVNDSLVSPNAYHVLAYLREAVHELGAAIHIACSYGIGPVRNLWYSARRCYRERFPFRMERRRANNYQLSSDSYAAAGNAMFKRKDSSPSSSSLSLSTSRLGINQLSPIPRVVYSGKIDRGPVYVSDYSRTGQERRFSKYTSTPLRFNDQEEDSRNRDVELTSQSPEIHTNKITYAQNHTLSRGENITMFSPKGSPWGMSISPKMRPRPAGVKTVQTVAGPLLASTRYNIDPKVLTDVSSPGLTMRLTKYATQVDANSKLTHQPQYGTGQFPKVNMHANPIPLLNAKLRKMRLPVTVRVAPPDIAKYSPPERQKILSNICHVENKSPTSVVQVLREISLKRHASMEDVSFDVAKKQKTESFFNEEREMVIEENKQKRGRNDSSISDEDLSPLSKSLRPAKRTKTRSCYDILNSLSSSIHVPVGIKRKAADFSRCGTPDFEKHFKSLESAQPSNSPTVPKFVNLDTELKIYSRSPEAVNKKTEDFPLVKGILKSSRESRSNLNKAVPVMHKTAKTVTKADDKPTKPINLTDKLFMRAEPEQNEQLKLLVEEPGNIKAKFATDNVEEIKRDDIRNMRQTSMKARLKSMFDAISGKGGNKINPDVVIQADDVNAVTSPITCPVTCATLNSSTTTTNVVTTPLSTAAVAPQGFSSSSKSNTKVDAKPTTTFSLPTAISPQTNVSATQLPVRSTTFELKAANSNSVTSDQTKVVSTASTTTSTGFLQKTQASSSIPSPMPTLTFGHEKSAATTTAVTSTSSSSSFNTSVPSSTTFESTAVTITPSSITSSTSTNFLTVNKPPISLTFTPISSSVTLGAKVVTNNVVATTATISSPITANTQVNPIFAFGGGKLSLSPATSIQTSASNLLPQTTGTTLLVNTTTTTSLAGFNNVTNTGTLNSVALTTSAAPALFTFGNNNVTSQPSKSDTFIFGQSNTTQKEPNTFGNPSSNQPTSLPQVTKATKSYNFTSNTLAPTSNSFTASIASFNSVANNATSSSVATITSAAPSLFTFGNNSTTLQSPKSDTFMFGQSNSVPKETNAFGNSANSQATTTLPQVTTKSFNFTSNTPATSNSFTSTNSAFTATTSATPAFNSPSAPTFSLGASITSSTSSISKPVFVFGAANTPSTASTPVALPAAPAPSTTGFSTTSNTAVPIFGATTAAAIPQFGASITTVPQFGTPTTSIFATSSSTIPTTNIFGSTSQPLFGTTSPVPVTSAVFSPKTTAPSIFAPTTNVVSTSNNTVSPGLFANVNVPPTSTTTSSSVFGGGSPIFGQTKPTTPLGTSSAGTMFGTTTPLFGSNTQTTTAPTFGITGNTSTNTIAPGFDTANDTPTVFDTPSSATVTSAQTTPAFNATAGMFGPTDNNASSVPIFGANAAPSLGAFGTTPAYTFGTPNLAFNSTSGNSTFGDNKSPFGAPPVSTTGFGTPSTSISSFGAANNANNPGNSTSNMFVFGSNQKDGQQNPTFSFGSNFTAGSNNPTTAASTSFQFGATSPKPATSGFNFATNSLSATPTLNFGATSMPTFNPSTPGMFSIGSGSTAPRSRSIRTRKPR